MSCLFYKTLFRLEIFQETLPGSSSRVFYFRIYTWFLSLMNCTWPPVLIDLRYIWESCPCYHGDALHVEISEVELFSDSLPDAVHSRWRWFVVLRDWGGLHLLGQPLLPPLTGFLSVTKQCERNYKIKSRTVKESLIIYFIFYCWLIQWSLYFKTSPF